MKWFKHMTDAMDDPKLGQLFEAHGHRGVLIYFWILEKIAAKMDESDGCELTTTWRHWAKMLRTYRKDLDKITTTCRQLGLILVTSSEDLLTISCPKLLIIRARQKPIGNQTRTLEVEVEVEVDKEEKKEKEKAAKSGRTPPSDLWNLICNDLPKATRKTEYRKKKEKARQREYTEEEIKDALEKIQASEFCKGKNERGWKATYGWFINSEENIAKVLEGKYSTTNKANSAIPDRAPAYQNLAGRRKK